MAFFLRVWCYSYFINYSRHVEENFVRQWRHYAPVQPSRPLGIWSPSLCTYGPSMGVEAYFMNPRFNLGDAYPSMTIIGTPEESVIYLGGYPSLRGLQPS